MSELLKDALSIHELSVLSSIVQVGDAAYRELLESQYPMLSHKYFTDVRGRIRTKLVQMQCEMESHDPNFPFMFVERTFSYNNHIPELHTKNVILHIARSKASDVLPHEAKYKVKLSNNNQPLCRQFIIDLQNTPPVALEPFYGLLVFGGRRGKDPFAVVQFPAPGYGGIADDIELPKVFIGSKTEEAETFERKKAGLKKEFLARGVEEVIS